MKRLALVDEYPVALLRPHPRNYKEHDLPAIAAAIKGGQHRTIAVRADDSSQPLAGATILAGHGVFYATRDLLARTSVAASVVECTDDEAELAVVQDNRTGERGKPNPELLADLLTDFKERGQLEEAGYEDADLTALLESAGRGEGASESGGDGQGALAARFGVPPFSVLDARQGYWQDRKRAWLSLGLRSEQGRGLHGHTNRLGVYEPTYSGARVAMESGGGGWTGTSVFDPVLCELVYRWFAPAGGAVLDPFAGGSVRGIVASRLGQQYTGIDLSERQVLANRDQWARLGVVGAQAPPLEQTCEPASLTPVERRGPYWVKRDDLCEVAGVRGGKVRTCWALAQGAGGLVTAGSRESPQANIVAHVAHQLGVPCRIHTPSGTLSAELQAAAAVGAEVVQHRPGYNTVIVRRAKDDAEARGWREIPFGMECTEAITQTRRQAENLPAEARRLVVPVGSGLSLAGILHGLRDHARSLPVLGVVVGADPTARLDRYAPPGWREMVRLVESELDYHQHAPDEVVEGLGLDPVYEAKCLPYLEPEDCLWCVGIRQTAIPTAAGQAPNWVVGDSQQVGALVGGEYDLVFTSPPYGDLEVYSDDPRDLSTMPYQGFRQAYRAVIAASVARLKPNRFACFVVADFRDRQGFYRGFVGDTVAAFQDAGLQLYNDAILVTAVGTLALRVVPPFVGYRKLGKTHQNVLVFYKGDPQQIKREFPAEIEFGMVAEEATAEDPEPEAALTSP